MKIIDITDKAAREIKDLMDKKSIGPEYSLRVGIRGQGCAGVRHFLAFDKPKSSDDQSEINGVPVVFDKKQALYLAGYRIDYEDGQEERGFFFSNEKDL